MLRIASPLALLPLLLASPALIFAQSPDGYQVAVPDEREAERIVSEARAEQARFERIRRNNLPWTQRRGGGCDPQRGDERIGRFCLSHHDTGEDYEPPPESPTITEARARLLEHLALAAQRVPWDGWLTGQRVRYLLESGDAESAAIAAHSCAAAEWWCAALAGYVHHLSGDALRADSAYTASLQAMPEEVAERWLDLSHLLEGSVLKHYQRMERAERAAFHDRFWKLAQLMYLRPGNDTRSEHLSRNVLDVLQFRARTTDGISWGEDLREILIRYGWPRGWERVRPVGLRAASGPDMLIGYYGNSREDRLPPSELLDPTVPHVAALWDQETSRARTHYAVPAPLAPTRWLRLDHQLARFTRRDSAIIVAAYNIPADSMPEGEHDLTAAVTLLDPGSLEPVTHPIPDPQLNGSLLVRAIPGEALLSLEVLSTSAGRAARVRRGIELPRHSPEELAISDILLLRTGAALPDSLEDAAPLARGSNRVEAGETVGLYWEIYGPGDDEARSMTISLSLTKRNAGWLRRAAQRIGLVSPDIPVRLRWREQSGGGSYHPRSTTIQIPMVTPGNYLLELTVTTGRGDEVRAERELDIV